MQTAPFCASWGVPDCSKNAMRPSDTTSKMNTAANTALPCRRSLTKRPKLNSSAIGTSSSAMHWMMLVSGVGFSSGLAEFTPL